MSDDPHADPSDPLQPGALPEPDPLALDVAHRRVRAALLGEVEVRRRVDERFALERELGSGGMGTVWSALDERLDRRVALKFMRAGAAEARDEARMVAEAKSLAKLSHPNVIPVYDVGRSEGRVWIAMEFVPGRTLREWIVEERPEAAAILAAWIDAGRGLAAVHAAGLIHRDLKPDNVMMGADGRVRLIDFGLVRGAERRPSADRAAELAETLSRAGMVATASSGSTGASGGFAGTPAYAAPEQLAGERVDARADQYAYCVSVWEALCGARPRHSSVEQERALSRRVRRVLERGLAAKPNDRYPEMGALLDELAPRRRTWLLPTILGAGLVAALGAAFAGVLGPEPEPAEPPCAQAGAAMAQLWTAERRAGLAAQLDGAPELLAALDGWSARWIEVADQACAEVHVEGVRSVDSLDPRRACLDERLVELESVLASVEGSAASAGSRGVRALALLDRPERCLAPEVLERAAPALDGVARARNRALQIELIEAWADLEGAPLEVRRRAVEELFEAARADGLETLAARVALVAGWMAQAAGDDAASRRWMGEVIDLGERAGDPALLAKGWNALGYVALDLEVDLEGARWAGSREAARVAALEPDDPLRAEAALQRARVLMVAGDFDGAQREAEAAVASLAAAGSESAWIHAAALRTLAEVLSRRGSVDEARKLRERAAAFEQGRALDVAGSLAAESRGATFLAHGMTLLGTGELDAAEAEMERALAAFETESGPRSRDAAKGHMGLVAVADARGELERAAEHARAADAILRAGSGPLDFDRFYALTALGTVAFRQGEFEAAREAYDGALRVAEAHLPPRSVELAIARMNLGEALVEGGQAARAEGLLSQALEVAVDSLGPDSDTVAIARKGLGAARLARGDAEGARVELEQALAIHLVLGASPVEQAQTRRLLAESLAAQDRHGPAAEQARAAIREFQALGPQWRERAESLQQWLDSQPAPDPSTRGK